MDEHELPLDMMFDIFSRMPVKSLARFKCVSKQWCKLIDDPHLAIMHTEEPIPLHLYWKTTRTTVSKKKPVLEFQSNGSVKFLSLAFERGSCYGLLFFEIRHINPSESGFIITHPLRKENYELPPMDTSLTPPVRESYGLGFDHSTNTFKIVKVLLMKNVWSKDPNHVRQNSRAMVHVLGTRSWREISNVPSYPVSKIEAVFAHGFLYWFMGPTIKWGYGEKKVICFDVTKEEFGTINPPNIRKDIVCVVTPFNLNGDLGVAYTCYDRRVIEVWVMKEKLWKIHYQFDQKPPLSRGINYFIGVWNKDGDILVQSGQGSFFVFELETGRVRQINIVDVEGYLSTICIYTPSLFSINGITPNLD